jgi:hypothetical protein
MATAIIKRKYLPRFQFELTTKTTKKDQFLGGLSG